MDPVSASTSVASSFQAFRLASADAPAAAASVAPAQSGIFDGLVQGLEKADELQKAASAVQDAFAAGKDIPVHQVMASAEKASLSLELMVAVRNRALEAYQEIMRMQV